MDLNVSTQLHDAIRSGNIKAVKTLLAMGIDINGLDVEYKNRTPLHIAAEKHDLDMVKLLLSHGANANLRDNTGMTPLSVVIAVGAVKSSKSPVVLNGSNTRADATTHKIIEALLAGGADVNKKNPVGRSHLILAILVGDFRVAKRLVEAGADVNSQDDDGKAALHLAALNNDVKMAKYLLSQGANINIKCNDNETALHVAIDAGNIEVADYLINAGIDIDCRENDRGYTVLHIIAETSKNIPLVKKLIARKVDLGIKNDEGVTALGIALVTGAFQVADLLIEAGGDVNSQAIDGSTVLHLAANDPERKYVTDGVKLAKALLNRGVDVNIQNFQGQTALHLALINKELEMAKFLINSGANVNCREESNFTPLHLAAFIGDISLVRLLISRGADINVQSYEGNTALHVATIHKEEEIVEELLSRGANKCAENKKGHTALEIAVIESNCHFLAEHFTVTEENTYFQDATFTRRHMAASRKSPQFEHSKSLSDVNDLKDPNKIHFIATVNMKYLQKKKTKKAFKNRGKVRCKCEPLNRLMLFYFEALPDDSIVPIFFKN